MIRMLIFSGILKDEQSGIFLKRIQEARCVWHGYLPRLHGMFIVESRYVCIMYIIA